MTLALAAYASGAACMFLYEGYQVLAEGFLEEECSSPAVRTGLILGVVQRGLGSALTWPLSLAVHVWAAVEAAGDDES